MVRTIAWLMRVSNGSFSHDEIMRLTWRQFETYLDSFRFLLREESEEGRRENMEDDLTVLAGDESLKAKRKTELEEIREKMKIHKERAERKLPKRNERKLVQ